MHSARLFLVALILVVPLSARAQTAGRAGPDTLSWTDRVDLERALAADDDTHRPVARGGSVALGGARIDARGAHLALARGELAIALRAIGRGSVAVLGPAGAPEIAGPEVRVVRAPGVVEWWRSLPSGLEQGVTIDARPAGAGPLVLEMGTSEGVRARLESSDDIVLVRDDGAELARYAHLLVRDARGVMVPARLAVVDARIRIQIDDAAARYPLVVDPLISATQEAMLRQDDGPLPIVDQEFGYSVAISGDGSRAIVGAPRYSRGPGSAGTNFGTGRVRIFARSGTTWSDEAMFTGTQDSEYLGWSVAMSADGSVALAGAIGRGTGGAGRVYRRTGTTWAFDGTLTPTGGAANDRAGWSVALSPEGTLALLGVPEDDTAGGADAGSVVVFAYGGSSWAQEARVIPVSGSAGARFGESVAVSGAGGLQLAVFGAPNDDPGGRTNIGSVYLYLRSGTTWGELGRLTDPAGAAGDLLGTSVAIDVSGTHVLAGAPGDGGAGTSEAGSAHYFALRASEWRYEGRLLPPPTTGISHRFGISVALSADARRALVGAPGLSTSDTGRATIFVRSGTTFTEDLTLSPTAPAGGDRVGWAVGLSGDGTRAIVGMPNDDVSGTTDEGSARVFRLTAGLGTPCGVAADCASGFCVEGVCCSSACSGGTGNECQACTAARTGVADGTCAPVTAGTVCRASTGACDPADVCDGTSVACATGFSPAGTVCRASTGPCDAEETCQGSNDCPVDADAPDGTSCADGDVCNGSEACAGGSCASGTPLDCEDGDVCTAHACDAIAGCSSTPIAGCCNLASECDDGDVCNGIETCGANVCAPGTPLACDDGNACTADACDALAGCTNAAIEGCCNDASECDDGDECTQDECTGLGGTCTHAPLCDDAGAGGEDAGVAMLDGGVPAGDAGPSDGGVADDASEPSPDASSSPDAGSAGAESGGCSCRAAGSGSSGGALLLPLVALLWLARRRR